MPNEKPEVESEVLSDLPPTFEQVFRHLQSRAGEKIPCQLYSLPESDGESVFECVCLCNTGNDGILGIFAL